jgi:hypothetical protein
MFDKKQQALIKVCGYCERYNARWGSGVGRVPYCEKHKRLIDEVENCYKIKKARV